MTDRYIITSRACEPVARTNDIAEANRLARILKGEVIDQEGTS